MCFDNIDDKSPFSGITEVLHLSTNRLDRLPFHFERWSLPYSIVIQLTEDEFPSVLSTISRYHHIDIRWSFYIIPQDSSPCYSILLSGEKETHESCYDMNILRNIGIETIRTTHFLMIDGDGLISRRR